jgi:hypothetical protein
MTHPSRNKRCWVFGLIMLGCALFVVVTLIAMLFYPGGTMIDPTTSGYSFFANVLSELGMTQTYAGQPNTASRLLFTIALTLTGAGLAAFFVAFRQFFVTSRLTRILSGLGSVFGVVSGICLIGAALTPIDLLDQWHFALVTYAFVAFAAAAVLYANAIRREADYPTRFALVFDAFSILLLIYLCLAMLGPPRNEPVGMMLQATAQKIIVYAAVISVMVQSYGYIYMLKTRLGESVPAYSDTHGALPGKPRALNADLAEGDVDGKRDWRGQEKETTA